MNPSRPDIPGAFLADITAHPDDDTPRLILADWLDDHGESERAEFIRLQVESSRLGENDPRSVALDARAEAILAERENDWLGKWTDRLVRWTFRRGFLDAVTLLPQTFLDHGEDMFAQFPVQRVRLVDPDGEGARPKWPGMVSEHPAFDRVRSLDVTSAASSLGGWAWHIATRTSWPALREVLLGDDSRSGEWPVNGGSLAAFCDAASIRGLESLDIHTCYGEGLRDSGVGIIGEGRFASQLRSLVLDGQAISNEGVGLIARDGVFPRLERLRLASCTRITAEGLRYLLQSPHLEDLRELCVSRALPLMELADMPALSRIRHLELFPDVSVTFYLASTWLAFARSPHLRNLEHLSVSGGFLSGESGGVIADAECLPALRSLGVWRAHEVGNALIEALSRRPLSQALTSLELTLCDVTDAGIRTLAQSPMLGTLRHLRLSWAEANRSTLETLLASPFLRPGLRRLDLTGWDLSGGGYKVLASCPRLTGLRELALGHTRLDPEGMAALLASPYLRGLTSLMFKSERSAEALRLLATSPGLPRLRELIVGNGLAEDVIESLRDRFGPRLIVFADV